MGEKQCTLRRNSFLIHMRLTYEEDKASIKLDRQQKNINPVDYAVWGALQKDVYRVPIVGLEDLKDKVRTCWASFDQQLIKKAIDPWRQTLTISQAVARIADRTAKNCRGHVT